MSKKVFVWLFKKAGANSAWIAVMIAINALLSVIGVRFALVSKELIDVATGQVPGSTKASFIKLAVYLVLQIALVVFGSLLDARVRGKLEIRIKRDLFCSLLKKDWQTLTKIHSGELMNRLTSDVSVIIGGIVDILPTFVSLSVTIVMSAYYLFVLAPKFAFFVLPLGPIVLIFGRIYSKKVKKLHKKVQESDGKTRSFMQEMLQNIIPVKTFGVEEAVSDNASVLQTIAYKLKIKRNLISTAAGVSIYVIFTAGYYVTLGWGALMISANKLTYGTLIALLRLVSQVQTPCRSMSSLLTKAFSTFASAERIIELEGLQNEETENVNNSFLNASSVSLEDVTFRYMTKNFPTVENVDLTFNKGEFVAITGISGIGKSTVLKLMLGLVSPTSGNIYLKAGNDKIPLGADTRSYFSYVPQENMILSGTIKDNIRFYNEGATDSDILRAAKIACVDEFAEGLENGYNTVLSEGGLGLSGGQIQRIAIARALIYDSPMLLLDEATSALDEETEEKVLKNLKALTEKSVIIVSHKNAALNICDKVIKIEDGKFISEEIANGEI